MAKKSSAAKTPAKKAATTLANPSVKKGSTSTVSKTKAKAKSSVKEIDKKGSSKPPKGKEVKATLKPKVELKSEKSTKKEPVGKTAVSAIENSKPSKESAKLNSKASGADSGKSEKTKAMPSVASLTKVEKANMTEDQVRWHEMLKKFGKDPVQNYSMSGQFLANAPIMHKKLGWGYVLSNDMDRLEILFESGKKILISNYKPS